MTAIAKYLQCRDKVWLCKYFIYNCNVWKLDPLSVKQTLIFISVDTVLKNFISVSVWNLRCRLMLLTRNALTKLLSQKQAVELWSKHTYIPVFLPSQKHALDQHF